jgi:hypothetical protein
VRLLRCLAVLGCLCLLAISAQADPTVCTFSGAATDTNYTEYGNLSGHVVKNGPPNAVNYYRLTTAGVLSTNNMIAFDTTQVGGPKSSVTVDFDYRIGGTPDNGNPSNHADGIGFCLLNTAMYGTAGQPPGNITEEAQGNAVQDGTIGVGLDTWNNSFAGVNDPDNNHLSFRYNDMTNGGNGVIPSGATCYIILANSLYPFNYQLHQGEPGDAVSPFDDTKSPFDHFNMTVNFGATGATVTITITPGAGRGAAFSPISGLLLSGVQPYEMRAAFGARTGGSSDNHDIANLNIVYQ